MAATAAMLLPHPSQRVRLIEDWIAGTTAGTLNWSNENAGTGAAPSIEDTQVDASHWGILELHTGSTATGRSGTDLGSSATTHSILPSGGNGFSEWLIKIPTLSTAGERYAFGIGYGDIFNAEFTNGSYFYYDESVGTTWLAKTANAATRTSVDTAVTVVAGAWIKLRIENSGSTSRRFFINGTLVATITTNIPTTAISPAANVRKSAGTTTRLIYIDYFMMDQVFITAR